MIKYLLLLVLLVAVSGCGIEQIDEGYRGVKKTWGKVDESPLKPDLYFYNPISSDILELDVREHKIQGDEFCFTRDTQNVKVGYSVTVYPMPDKIAYLYSQFGKNWDEKVIPQTVLGALKDAIGQYVADDLISKREAARDAAFKELKNTLAERFVIVTRLDLTNLDFSDEYERSVEAKVVATQRAAEAKNKTVQIEEEAKQKVKSAQADAEAMRIKSQALAQNKGLVEYEAVQRWNGKLPEIMLGNSTPIINLGKIGKSSQ